MEKDQFTVEMAQAFHKRIAAIVDQVQAGIWQAGQHELLGFDTDFGFGQSRGVQTLVLKTSHRSTYLRLHWDTILGESDDDREQFDNAIRTAIAALS